MNKREYTPAEARRIVAGLPSSNREPMSDLAFEARYYPNGVVPQPSALPNVEHLADDANTISTLTERVARLERIVRAMQQKSSEPSPQRPISGKGIISI